MQQLILWMMTPKREQRPQKVSDIMARLHEQHCKEDDHSSLNDSGSEEATILIPPAMGADKNAHNELNPKAEEKDSKEEARTILVVSRGNDKSDLNKPSLQTLPPRTIKVGDFIFEDGSYSAERRKDDKRVVGVLFSHYGEDHGLIMSPVKQSYDLSINGKKLEWHEASIGEWVEVIQNLGKTKVTFVSWDDKYYSKEVKVSIR